MALAGAAVLILASCESQPMGRPSKSAPTASNPPPGEIAEYGERLQKGDYAGTIAFVLTSHITPIDKDGVIGNLILDGLVDPKATTRPPYPLAEGFNRLERAASAGRTQSVSDLRAKFTTGINFEGRNFLMPPNAALAKCWAGVESGSGKASDCIAMRQKLHVP